MTRETIDRVLDACELFGCVCAFVGYVIGATVTLPIWFPLMVIRK